MDPWWPLNHDWASRDLQPPALPYSSSGSSSSSSRRTGSSSRSRRKRGGRRRAAAAAAETTTTSQVCSVAFWTWLQLGRNCIPQYSSSLQQQEKRQQQQQQQQKLKKKRRKKKSSSSSGSSSNNKSGLQRSIWTWLQLERNCIPPCSSSLQLLVGIIDPTSPWVQTDHTNDFRPLNNRPPEVSTSSMYVPMVTPAPWHASLGLACSAASGVAMRQNQQQQKKKKDKKKKNSNNYNNNSNNNNSNDKSGLQYSLLNLLTVRKKPHTIAFVFHTVSWEFRLCKPMHTSRLH